MARVQMGVRVSDAGAARVDEMVQEFSTTRADVLRAILSEAMANANVMAAARARLKKATL